MARLLSFFSIATASLRRRQESRFHIFIPNEVRNLSVLETPEKKDSSLAAAGSE
jgi:hypothetical protein